MICEMEQPKTYQEVDLKAVLATKKAMFYM